MPVKSLRKEFTCVRSDIRAKLIGENSFLSNQLFFGQCTFIIISWKRECFLSCFVLSFWSDCVCLLSFHKNIALSKTSALIKFFQFTVNQVSEYGVNKYRVNKNMLFFQKVLKPFKNKQNKKIFSKKIWNFIKFWKNKNIFIFFLKLMTFFWGEVKKLTETTADVKPMYLFYHFKKTLVIFCVFILKWLCLFVIISQKYCAFKNISAD